MRFTQEEKNELLKTFTNLLKNVNGKGPRNIYIKYFDNELHVVIQGVITDFEKYLINNFGEEAIEIFRSFYERDSYNFEKLFLRSLEYKYPLTFYQLESDFDNDIFTYKMKILE
jgi:uncharacterized protein YbcI